MTPMPRLLVAPQQSVQVRALHIARRVLVGALLVMFLKVCWGAEPWLDAGFKLPLSLNRPSNNHLDVERHRWLGRSRTVFCGAKKLLSRVVSHEGTVWLRRSTGTWLWSMPGVMVDAMGHAPLLHLPGALAPCLRSELCTTCPGCVPTSAPPTTTWTALPQTRFCSLTIGPNMARNMSVAPEGLRKEDIKPGDPAM